MVERVVLETLVVRDLGSAVGAWRAELGWELRAEAAVEEPLAAFWHSHPDLHPRFAILASPGSSRGFVRLIEGVEADAAPTFERRGLFNAELLCADVELLHERLRRSRAFAVLSAPSTYDLGETGGAVSRSFASRGPGGAAVFFTQYLSVPPPRTLPRCESLVGPMFNSAVAVTDAAAMASFYEGVLAMGRRFEMRVAQAGVNRILGFPEDGAFHMVVYKGKGDGLVEIDVHDRPLPARAVASGRMFPGNASLTLETPDVDGVVARAAARGVLRRGPQRLSPSPYDGRRAARLEGPGGEWIEIVEAV